MKHLNIGIAVATVLATACSTGKVDYAGSRPTSFVDPFTGTGANGHVFLGANVPFGMVQAGPSQSVKGWDWCSGYHYSDTTLLGFSQTHLSGTGVGDLGDILLLPALNATDSIASFSHDYEVCCPGYYTVTLDNGIITDITATTRTAFYRFSYPQSSDSVYLKIDLGYGTGWDRPTHTEITIDNDSTVTGYRRSSGWARDQHI
ncbi:MAG: glycoside hydrolase family 92 protein, partial [Muribaculaceae bacterium]|nr:glycoside hydrolase family 92 protein [Muribaculaceae bacterium]